MTHIAKKCINSQIPEGPFAVEVNDGSIQADETEYFGKVKQLSREEQSQQRLQVLIVEDDSSLADLLRVTFESHGYQADLSFSGTDAKARIKDKAYDAIILDHHLPDIKGDQLLVQIQQMQPDTIYLAMTGDSSPELALSWIRKGASAFIRKPCLPDYVVELCSRSRRERDLLSIEKRLKIRTQELIQIEGRLTTKCRLAEATLLASEKQQEMLISKLQHEEARLRSLANILQHSGDNLQDFIDYALEEAVILSGSKIGCLYFYDENRRQLHLNSWSKNCHSESETNSPQKCLELDCTGILGEAVLREKSIMINDFSTLRSPIGAIENLITLNRLLVVPVINNDKISAVIAVANKQSDYEIADMEQIQLLMDAVWKVVQQREAMEACVQSEKMFRTVFENSPIALEIYGKDGVLIDCNSRANDVFGTNVKSYIGAINLRDDPNFQFEEDWQPLLSGEEVRREITYEFGKVPYQTSKTGLAYLDVLTTPVPHNVSEKIGFIRQIIDVTQRKCLEAQIRQTQKLESVGQLAGGVAHDFNNILAAMMIRLSFIQNENQLDGEMREAINEVMCEAKRAANLTRQLLMFSRRSMMGIKLLDINDLVTNLLKMLGRIIGEHIVVRFERHENLPAIEADPSMVEQVLMNLAVNARDAMPRGGELDISIEPIQIEPCQVKEKIDVSPGLYVCMTVTDNGCGMDESIKKKIFEPFFTTKEVGKGTGLGLATVYGIVAQHKGWIEVESQMGKGTKFKVFFPASLKGWIDQIAQEEMLLIRGSETILLVEDDTNLRQILGKGFGRLGYKVIEAPNGRVAQELWKKRTGEVDLLFTDMIMPEGFTGLDLAEKLLKDKPALKVIIASGYHTDKTFRDRSDRAGIKYLQKPFQFHVLSKFIRDCLDSRTVRPESTDRASLF